MEYYEAPISSQSTCKKQKQHQQQKWHAIINTKMHSVMHQFPAGGGKGSCRWVRGGVIDEGKLSRWEKSQDFSSPELCISVLQRATGIYKRHPVTFVTCPSNFECQISVS